MLRTENPYLRELQREQDWKLAQLYHENTKINKANVIPFADRVQAGTPPLDRMAYAKSYPGHPSIALKGDFRTGGIRLTKVLRQRRSRRNFEDKPIALDTLARLLWFCSAESGELILPDGGTHRLRPAPSSGGLHSIEIYPILFSATGVESGRYHYNAHNHTLEQLQVGEDRNNWRECLFAENMIDSAAGVLVLTAVAGRVMHKYGDRGYRFIHIDAGHLAQNLLLMAEELGIGAVPLGGFFDDAVDQLLQIDGKNEFVVYPILIGHVSNKGQ